MTLNLTPITPGTLTLTGTATGSIAIGPVFTVTDGSTDVTQPGTLKFSGATVTESPTGTALVTITGGGSQPWTLVQFPFAFNTAGLADGVTVYTPAIGDILMEVWWEVLTAFDGTTPFADVGTFVGQATGIWHDTGVQAFTLTVTGNEAAGAGMFVGPGTDHVSGAASVSEFYALAGDGGTPVLPGRFTTTNPVKLVVSQDGTKGGTAIDSAAGSGVLNLMIFTP